MLHNTMRSQAARHAAQFSPPRHGLVTSYDPIRHAAKVQIMPEGAFPEQTGDTSETGWLPIMVPWSGPGWGFYSPPAVGDQVHVAHVEGYPGAGVIVGRVYDLKHAPLAVPSGELWLVHQSGSFIKLTNDGKLTLQDQSGVSLAFENNGTAALTGDLAVTGNITATGDVTAGAGGAGSVTLLNHKHSNVTNGPGETNPPVAGT